MPLNNMGQALQGRARYDEAAEFYMNALALEPNSARFHANYASLFNDQDRHEEAIDRYRHALAIDPNHAESHCGMGQAYLQLQEPEKAEASFRKALEIDPELTAPRLGLANLYSEMGDFPKAEAEAAIALESHPKLAEVYYQTCTHRKGKVGDDVLEAMTALIGEKYLGEGSRAKLNFALGTVHDRRKNYKTAGQCFQIANELQAATRLNRNEIYDPQNFTDWVDNLIAGFTPDLFSQLKGSGHASRRPIFIVGLPRSGTTLTEQILASHSKVHGAGELTFINKTFEGLPNLLGLSGMDAFSALKSADSRALKISADFLFEANRGEERKRQLRGRQDAR